MDENKIDFYKLKSFHAFRLGAELELVDDALFKILSVEFVENLKKFAVDYVRPTGRTLPMPKTDTTKILEVFVRRFNTELNTVKADWYIQTDDGKYTYATNPRTGY
jgi:hypothetical protein